MGLIGHFISWLNELESGSRDLLLLFLGSGLAGLGWCFLWAIRRISAARRDRERKKRAAEEAARAADLNRLGFSEALVAEDEAARQLPLLLTEVARIVKQGVERQERIKGRQAAFNASAPNARRQFDRFWEEHARSINQTTQALRKHVGRFREQARILRECQVRLLDWNRLNGIEKPPERWIDGYPTFVAFREQARGAQPVFSPEATIERWDPRVRAMNRKLDRAIHDYASVCGEQVEVFKELESTCTVIIEAVDHWRKQASGWRRFFVRRRPRGLG